MRDSKLDSRAYGIAIVSRRACDSHDMERWGAILRRLSGDRSPHKNPFAYGKDCNKEAFCGAYGIARGDH